MLKDFNISNLGELIGIAFAVSFLYIIKEIIPSATNYIKKNKIITFNKNIEIQNEIQKRVWRLRDLIDADRVSIFEFTNGDKTVSNIPFKYINMTYEATSSQVKEIQKEWVKIPITHEIFQINLLSKSENQIITLNSQDKDEYLSRYVKSKEVAQIIDCVINKDNFWAGFISIFYIGEKHKIIEMEEYIKQTAYEINNLMKKLK